MAQILAALSLFFTYNAFAFNCTSFWVNGFPDADVRRAENPCDESVPSVPIDPRIKVYYTQEIEISATIKDRLEILARALDYAYGKYVALGEMPPVKAIFYHRPHYSDAESTAFSFLNLYREGEACPILLYPLSNALSKPHFEQLIAHELFHCFQNENAKQQVDVVLASEEGLWWFEGLAQIFSNIVYPNHDFEYHSYFGAFDDEVLIYEQESKYRLVHFFQSYYNNTGMNPSTLVELMRRFPTTATGDEAQIAMRIPDIADKIHKYAEELATETLLDSSGATADVRSMPILHELTSAIRQEVHFDFADFTVKPHRVVFPAGYRYRITVNNSVPAKLTARKVEETTFHAVPSVIETTCDTDRKFDFVITSVNSPISMNRVTLAIESEVLDDCSCNVDTAPKDECLAGTWELDNSSADDFMRRMLQGSGRVMESTGNYRVTFTREGEVSWKMENFATRVELAGGRGTMVNTLHGSSGGRYSTGQQRICSQGVWNNIRAEMVITVGGQTTRRPSAPPFNTGGGQFGYACDGDTFHYKTAIGIGPGGSDVEMNYIFNRVH